MTQPPSTNWEMTLSLPLGVVDNQLRKVEEQLRTLNMKALDFGEQCEDRALRLLVSARLENIGGLADSIADLVASLITDCRPKAPSKISASSVRPSHPDLDD